jgi:hypothetical protein
MQTNEQGKDFAEWLADFAKGSANAALTKRLAEVVQACRENSGKGSITLKLSIGCAGGMSEVKAKIAYTKPDPALPSAVFFSTEDGALVEEDPRQLNLPAAKVLDIAPVRTINTPNNTNG